MSPWPEIALLLVILGSALRMVWSRSTFSLARRLQKRVSELKAAEMPTFFDQELMEILPADRRPEILDEAAGLLERDGDKGEDLAALLRATAGLARAIPSVDRSSVDLGGPEERLRLADALEAHAEALTRVGQRSLELEQVSRTFALQDWFLADMLRAEGPSHLAALSDDVEELNRWAAKSESVPEEVRILYGDLLEIVRVLGQLARLPGAEDRSLFLGQALTRLLGAQEASARRQGAELSFGSSVLEPILESTRQLLATALKDIRQRAQLSLILRSRVLHAERRAVLVLDLRNDGQGHAENIIVEAAGPDASLRVIEPRQHVRRLLREQSARLEFPIEPRTSDRVRVSFRITYDDLERPSQVRELADIVELRHERHRVAFRPLRPNPYVVGRPLTEQDVFIGRADVFAHLDASLHGAHQDNVVVLIGQRRMGKTSILRRLDRHLGADYLPVLIDLQGVLSPGEAAFLNEVALAVFDELSDQGYDIEEPCLDDFVADPGSAFRRRFLRQVKATLGDRRLLLIFDEFEVLEERIAGGDLDRKVLPFFRSLMQHEKQISFIFAGTHRLEELTGDYWGVLFNLAIYLQVGHLPQEEVERLFVEPTREVFDIDPLALEKAYRITGGHPHFSQLLARELVELRNREHLTYITVREINTVAARVIEQGQLHISYLWDEASKTERLLLLALTALLAQEGTATMTTAHRYLVGRRVDPGDLPAAARSLAGREILDDRAGQLSFRMELLRRWIDCYRDLESHLLSEPGAFHEPTREITRPTGFKLS